MITGVNSEDRLVQRTFAEHLDQVLGWDSVYAYNDRDLRAKRHAGPGHERDVVLARDLRAALARLNPGLPEAAARTGPRS